MLNLPLLQTLFCGRNHRHIEILDSTNIEMKRSLTTETLHEGTLITCSEQQSGRGYAGAVWQSEAGKNIVMSLLLKPVFLEARFQFYLNQIVTLGIYNALTPLVKENHLKIKWPNDIMYKDKKLCGILIENTVQGNMLHHSIIGIGLNVNETGWKKKNLPDATSLKQITKQNQDVAKIIAAICEHIEAYYLRLKNGKLEEIQALFMKHLYRVEEKHPYIIHGKKMKAKIVGLNSEGRLVLDSKDGFHVCEFKEVEYIL